MAFRQLTITTTAQQVAAQNTKRTALSVKNLGAVRVFVDNDQSAIAAKGWYLDTGEGIVLTRQDGDDPELALFALTSALTADLRIQESFD